MADHLAALGIGSPSPEERFQQVREILRGARAHSVREESVTLRWSDSSGAELWIYVDRGGSLQSVQPHLSGGPRIRMEIQAVLERPEVSPYDGGFLCLTLEGGSHPALGGGYPVVFDAPDFPDVRGFALTSRHRVELAAFALDLSIYKTEEAFREAQPELKPLGVPGFVPAGMVGRLHGQAPSAHALLVGRALRVRRVRNQVTGREFYRITVETPAGPMDIAADPTLLTESPEVGDVVQAGVWLSGRIVTEEEGLTQGEKG